MWDWIVKHPIPVLVAVLFALATLGFFKPLRWLLCVLGYPESKIDALEEEVRGHGKK